MQEQQRLSIGGSIWNFPQADEVQCERMAQQCGIPLYLAQVMLLRGINVGEADSFLHPKLQNLLPEPYVLKDMQRASERIVYAIENKQKIAIIGDYDVDGATSTSELVRFFRKVGAEPIVHIPSREEGYGPSELAFAQFLKEKVNLVITIDCGTTAFEILNKAANDGFDIIVIDHHEAEVILPKVFAVVNPKRLDEDNDYPYLQYMSAVGVGFMTLVAVNRLLREHGFYIEKEEPNLLELLDLVALGTVCDVVPLLGLNRAYVRQGLKVMAKMKNVGLKQLMKILNLNSAPTAYNLGFALGPRINACGRVGDASLGSKLLCCENDEEAYILAEKFNQFNIERKEIENYVLLQAIEQVEGSSQEYPMAFVYGYDWHQGVIGIVAGKLKERYNIPAFVMSVEADEVKGSARSISGVDLGALIISAKEKGVIKGGGGHTMAAGFSLTEEQIPLFRKFVGEYILEKLGSEKISPVLNIDCLLSLSGVTEEFANNLSLLEPFGTGNSEPLVLVKDVMICRAQIVGSGHVRCTLMSTSGYKVSAIAFRVVDSDIGNALLQAKGEVYDVVGYVKCDEWNGRKKVQFIINDLRRKL